MVNTAYKNLDFETNIFYICSKLAEIYCELNIQNLEAILLW